MARKIALLSLTVLLAGTVFSIFPEETPARTSTEEFAAAIATGELPLPQLPENCSSDALVLDEDFSFIPFATGTWKMAKEVQEKLRRLARQLDRQPGWKILIRGYPDRNDTGEYNLALAWQRALAVRKALVILGVSPQRLYALAAEGNFNGCGLFLVKP
ncbi:MAG TPA: OmpA family protein [bacterium]|nr:OmpA family protein [bacterium]HPP12135.1 OmpA family protein [bacterium]